MGYSKIYPVSILLLSFLSLYVPCLIVSVSLFLGLRRKLSTWLSSFFTLYSPYKMLVDLAHPLLLSLITFLSILVILFLFAFLLCFLTEQARARRKE